MSVRTCTNCMITEACGSPGFHRSGMGRRAPRVAAGGRVATSSKWRPRSTRSDGSSYPSRCETRWACCHRRRFSLPGPASAASQGHLRDGRCLDRRRWLISGQLATGGPRQSGVTIAHSRCMRVVDGVGGGGSSVAAVGLGLGLAVELVGGRAVALAVAGLSRAGVSPSRESSSRSPPAHAQSASRSSEAAPTRAERVRGAEAIRP